MKVLLFFCVSLILNLFIQDDKIPFIKDANIIIDGNVDELSWKRVKKMTKNEHQIKCFQDSENMYISINNLAQDYVDLYFYLNNEQILNCHASMQLGERTINKTNLNPSYKWGNNHNWTANSISQKQLNDKNPTSFEFKIAKNKIAQNNFKLKIVSTNFFDENKKVTNTISISL